MENNEYRSPYSEHIKENMMDKHELTELLNHVADGSISPDDAALKLKIQPFQEIGEYAKVDFHRGIRQGVPEVIYGAGKAKEHILGIAKAMVNNGQKTILITRLSEEAAEFVKRAAAELQQHGSMWASSVKCLRSAARDGFWLLPGHQRYPRGRGGCADG